MMNLDEQVVVTRLEQDDDLIGRWCDALEDTPVLDCDVIEPDSSAAIGAQHELNITRRPDADRSVEITHLVLAGERLSRAILPVRPFFPAQFVPFVTSAEVEGSFLDK